MAVAFISGLGVGLGVGLGYGVGLDFRVTNRSSSCSLEIFWYPPVFLPLASILNSLIVRLDILIIQF